MKISHFILVLLGILFAVWWTTYNWFWEPAALTTLQWAFWISLLGSITLVLALIFHRWTTLAYVKIAVTIISSVILLIFQWWVLYSYMILGGIELWEIEEIINLMFLTNNNWILPIMAIVFALIALYETRLYSRAECPELLEICKA